MTSHRRSSVVSAVLLLTWSSSAAIGQTTWYVSRQSCPSGDGTVTDPFCTIQEGLDAAAPGDTVLVADGEYSGNGNWDISFRGKAITLQSANGRASCSIDGQGSHRAFNFANNETNESRVHGFTIKNGNAERGGGIYCVGCAPAIVDCTIRQCSAARGGGIYCEHAGPLIEGCDIYQNSSPNGSGIRCEQNSSPLLTDCRIYDNGTVTGSSGGGISCYDNSNPTLTRCSITINKAAKGGGVFCQEYSSPTFANCIISGNEATDSGGGVWCYAFTNPVFTNCVIAGNRSVGGGGGIYFKRSSPIITNCTFAGNIAPAGRALTSYSSTYPSNVVLSNCILWDGGSEIAISEGSSVVVTYSNVQDGWSGAGGSNIDDDPLFLRYPDDGGDGWGDDPATPDADESVNDDYGDLRLRVQSPCVDAADNDAVPSDVLDLDQDGNSQEKIPFDIGAVRTIEFDIADLDSVEKAKIQIGRQIEEFKKGHKADSPVSVASTAAILQGNSELAEEIADKISSFGIGGEYYYGGGYDSDLYDIINRKLSCLRDYGHLDFIDLDRKLDQILSKLERPKT